MKKFKWIALLSLSACTFGDNDPECPEATYWESRQGQKLKIGCGQIKWSRPEPKCELEGAYEELESTNLAWELDRTCFQTDTYTALCYFAESDLGDHAAFSCQDLGIHNTFHRVK